MRKIEIASNIYLGLIGITFLVVAAKGLIDPQLIMDLVNLDMGNNVTARNSIRALYGGVHLAFGLFVLASIYFKLQKEALGFTALYTAGFVFGRVLSMMMDGTPGDFAKNWLLIESVLFVVTMVFVFALTPKRYPQLA